MGTSTSHSRKVSLVKDHPHAYGDKFRVPLVYRSPVGSSPRVWGQVVPLYYITGFSRIIPTRMGTSFKSRFAFAVKEDHPHAYGDKTKEIKENSGFAKSTA